MTYCTECGQDHHAGERKEREAEKAEVEIARITANRDVEVAKVQARITRDEVVTEAAAAEAHAEGLAEGVETGVEAVTGGGDAPAEGDGPAVVVEAPGAAEEPAEPAATIEPAEEDHGGPPEPPRKSFSYWG